MQHFAQDLDRIGRVRFIAHDHRWIEQIVAVDDREAARFERGDHFNERLASRGDGSGEYGEGEQHEGE